MRASAPRRPRTCPPGCGTGCARGHSAHGAGGQLGHAGVGGRQRDRAAGGQAFHQHAPALAGHGGAADDEVQRHEHVLAARRAVHEHGVQREVAAARVDAGVVVRHQRAGDAQVLLVAQQSVRVIQAERQAEQGADRRQRDVALVPGDAHADHFAALPFALADDAAVGNGGGVEPAGAGQREAGTSSPRAGAADSDSSAHRCRSAAAARPGPASSAP